MSRPIKKHKIKAKAVSLFTGCGGSDLGIHQLGFDVVMANDVMSCAAQTYAVNLPETDYVVGDIRAIKSFPDADLLMGCYPCQGYSQGGLRESDRDINFLFREFARALNAIKPRAFVVENVAGLIRSNFRPLFDEQLKTFTDAGYRVKYQVLNAAHYGVAQERKRVLIVGIRDDIDAIFSFPEFTHGTEKQSFTSQKDALKDLPVWPVDEAYYKEAFHWYYMSRDRYRGWDQPAKTIVANPRHLPLHPASPKLVKVKADEWRFDEDRPARRYTPIEAARLQGFPKDFVLPEHLSLNNKYKVVGNAVPPPLMRAVVGAIPDIW
jgi:DNA (cytosine-5)-methyltransferase 1